MGYAQWRFLFNRPPEEQRGSAELTDGYWVWPEGLVKYVETHKIRLPVEFIEHMKRTNFEIDGPWKWKSESWSPEEIDEQFEYFANAEDYSFDFWVEWCKNEKKKNCFIDDVL